MSNYFSPISLTGPYFYECDMYVSRDAPKSELNLIMNLVLPETEAFIEEDGKLLLHHDMHVNVKLTEGDHEETAREAMHINLGMTGIVALPLNDQVDRAEAEETLRLNAISLFYASARSFIEMNTAQSPMKRFTIPPINPIEFLRMSEKTSEQ